MGQITIEFHGICTHFRKLPEPIPNVSHRVVLVHAENGSTIHGRQIPPHLPTLEVDLEDFDASVPALLPHGKIQWQLEGLRLTVANTIAGIVVYDPTYDSIPQLTKNNPDFGELAHDVVYGQRAACHFDVTAGRFHADWIGHGAWASRLHIETDGDPILSLTPLAGGSEKKLTLRSGAIVVVKNTGEKGLKETRFDFYLHYLTAAKIPAEPYAPPTIHPYAGDALGPGCSNSSYP